MEVKTIKEKFKVRKNNIREKSSLWVEQDILVPDVKPDILKILRVSSIPFVEKSEVSNGKIKIKGKINSYILYRTVDESNPYKMVTYSYDYNEIIKLEKINENMTAVVNPQVRNVIFQTPNERKISLKNELLFDIDFVEEETIEVLNKLEDSKYVEIRNEKIKLDNIVYKKEKEVEVREEIILDGSIPDIDEIAFENHKISNIEYKQNFNKILVKGDIEGYLVYTTRNAEKILNKEKFEIPFTTFFELDNIKENSIIDIRAYMTNFVPRKNTDNITSSSVIVDASLKCDLVVSDPKEVEAIKDFYYLNKEEKIQKKETRVQCIKPDIIENEIEITHNVRDIINENDNIIEETAETGYITTKIVEDSIYVEGNLKLNILTENAKTKEISSKSVDVPVEYVNKEIAKNVKSRNIDVAVKGITLNKQGNNLQIKIILVLKINDHKEVMLDIIENIDITNLDMENLNDITIYVVKKGDTLWHIAKLYKTTVDNIVKSNKIEDPNQLVIGQKLIIIR